MGLLVGCLPARPGHSRDTPVTETTWTYSRQTAPLERHLAALVGRPLPSALRFDTDPVVDRSADSLFATKVALSGLNRNVAEEELNLFQFSACCVT
jgi:hypothetical protein